MIKKILFVIGLIASFGSFAQEAYNTGATPPDTNVGFSSGGTDSAQGNENTPAAKPYVRVKLAMDTITNLITYKEVVEQDESQEDSIYIRCLKYMKKRFGVYGKMIPVNKKDEKIQARLRLPVYTKPTAYAKYPAGNIEFTFTLDIKAGRYRYRIDNITHILPPNSLDPNPKPVYLEYYQETKSNVKNTDLVLKSADEEIKKFIVDLKKKLKDPVQVDEDDW